MNGKEAARGAEGLEMAQSEDEKEKARRRILRRKKVKRDLSNYFQKCHSFKL